MTSTEAVVDDFNPIADEGLVRDLSSNVPPVGYAYVFEGDAGADVSQAGEPVRRGERLFGFWLDRGYDRYTKIDLSEHPIGFSLRSPAKREPGQREFYFHIRLRCDAYVQDPVNFLLRNRGQPSLLAPFRTEFETTIRDITQRFYPSQNAELRAAFYVFSREVAQGTHQYGRNGVTTRSLSISVESANEYKQREEAQEFEAALAGGTSQIGVFMAANPNLAPLVENFLTMREGMETGELESRRRAAETAAYLVDQAQRYMLPEAFDAYAANMFSEENLLRLSGRQPALPAAAQATAPRLEQDRPDEGSDTHRAGRVAADMYGGSSKPRLDYQGGDD